MRRSVELLGIDPVEPRDVPTAATWESQADGQLLVRTLVYDAAPGIPVSALLWRGRSWGSITDVLGDATTWRILWFTTWQAAASAYS